jgi:seryl-tRNA(Sec) selenium transferase
MTRIKISAGIMILLILTCAFSTYFTEKKYLRLESMLESLQEEISNGEYNISAADELSKYWERVYQFSSLFVRSEKINTLQNIFPKITPWVENHSAELNAELENLKQRVKSLYEEERPLLKHIF